MLFPPAAGVVAGGEVGCALDACAEDDAGTLELAAPEDAAVDSAADEPPPATAPPVSPEDAALEAPLEAALSEDRADVEVNPTMLPAESLVVPMIKTSVVTPLPETTGRAVDPDSKVKVLESRVVCPLNSVGEVRREGRTATVAVVGVGRAVLSLAAVDDAPVPTAPPVESVPEFKTDDTADEAADDAADSATDDRDELSVELALIVTGITAPSAPVVLAALDDPADSDEALVATGMTAMLVPLTALDDATDSELASVEVGMTTIEVPEAAWLESVATALEADASLELADGTITRVVPLAAELSLAADDADVSVGLALLGMTRIVVP